MLTHKVSCKSVRLFLGRIWNDLTIYVHGGNLGHVTNIISISTHFLNFGIMVQCFF